MYICACELMNKSKQAYIHKQKDIMTNTYYFEWKNNSNCKNE